MMRFLVISALLAAGHLKEPTVAFGSDVANETASIALSPSPLAPVNTDSPRATIQSFIEAMNDYRVGVETNDNASKARINDAIATLDLSEVPLLVRTETARETAKLLKEILDRVLVVDFAQVPDDPQAVQRWRVPGTEIFIERQSLDDRHDEFLFSTSTVRRAPEFYARVRHLPYLEGLQGALYREPWQETLFPEWSRQKTFGYAYWQWIGLLAIIFMGLLARAMAKITLLSLKAFTYKTRVNWDRQLVESLERPAAWTVLGVFWMLSVHLLRFEGVALAFMMTITQTVLSFGLVWAAYSMTDLVVTWIRSWAGKSGTSIDVHIVPLISRALKIFVVIVGSLVALQNLGVNVFSLLAGLGLGGLAFALAARDTAANLFGSLMIFFDKPFKVGDWIQVNGQEGIVEMIGFRSTRIRTFYDSQVSIPNSVVANLNIDNFGRRRYRRVWAELGVTYDTHPEKLEAFLEGIKNIIRANPHTRKDYFQVVFNGYGDFNLQVLVVFYLKVNNWSAELLERQNIFIEIYRLAKDLGVDFAFPTQTLHVESFPEKKPTRIPSLQDKETLIQHTQEYGEGGPKSRPSGLGLFRAPMKDKDSIDYKEPS